MQYDRLLHESKVGWYHFCLQSDIIHQSVMELIHSEDREEFKRQLSWNSTLPQDKSSMSLHELMMPGWSLKLQYFNFFLHFFLHLH